MVFNLYVPGRSTSVTTYGPSQGGESFMAVLVVLHEVENQVPDVEGSVPHPSAMVVMQRLLVLG